MSPSTWPEFKELLDRILGHNQGHERDFKKLFRLIDELDNRSAKRHKAEMEVLKRIESKLDSPKGSMSLEFKEKTNMAITPQDVQLHVSTTVDVAGGAQDADGNAITLTNLAFTPQSSAIGSAGDDADATDDNDTIVTVATEGATDVLTFTADGSDGKSYSAVANITLVAKAVTVQPMALTFTERP